MLKEFFTEIYGVVNQVVQYLGANPDVLRDIISGLFLAIAGIWGFFIKGRKEGEKIDLDNEKAKLEIENMKHLNQFELAKKESELKATSTLKYQKALAELVLEEKKADIEAKRADIAAKKAETAHKEAETEKVKAEIKKIEAETENIRKSNNENNNGAEN